MELRCAICLEQLKHTKEDNTLYIEPCPSCKAEAEENRGDLLCTIEDLRDQLQDLKEEHDEEDI